ncbi:nucleoside hydrolase [Fodinibius sediminis]|uniref:Inosine-uridine nucleoside N-ribohydrolase n=1 Tax=Fodinibius sediminis TaxID=1214077 RepID=A0A521CGK1_9BACT|nr:nucleoside hydrolase [Fodinibius sediminis]SMO58564.1 Inosine-uridine nucleoside N-ribohydrolase [Fodinibius sediminis]
MITVPRSRRDGLRRHRFTQPCMLLLPVLLFSFALTSCHSDAGASREDSRDVQTQQTMRILFDSDTNNEIDDQHALAYLLFNSDVFDVEGVTVNSTKEPDVELDYAEAQRVLALCRASRKIPLKKGANGTFSEIRKQLDQPDFDGAEAVQFIIDRALAEEEEKLMLLAVGKLTNIALALEKEPAIAARTRLVWLGSNYPRPGEHNQQADTTALNYILNSDLPFEVVTVRYGQPSGTDAVRVTKAQILQRMPGMGPIVDPPVEGRHGGTFTTFGDYSVNLFEHYEMGGTPPSRPLFDMAAVAILKNPDWARTKEIPAPILIDNEWVDRPGNERTITLWEHFHIYGIMHDFLQTMAHPVLPGG